MRGGRGQQALAGGRPRTATTRAERRGDQRPPGRQRYRAVSITARKKTPLGQASVPYPHPTRRVVGIVYPS